MKPGIMLDLETMDTAVTAAIVSIGAARFSDAGVHDTFYRTVDWGRQPGRTLSADTIRWWMDQPAEVQAAARDPYALPLAEALVDLAAWIGSDVDVWAGPADFDLAILKHAYDNYGMSIPWAYYRTRCYSTVRRLQPNIPRAPNAMPHNALEDARAQAEHLTLILRALDVSLAMLGLESISTIEQFRDLVNSLDLATGSSQKMFASSIEPASKE